MDDDMANARDGGQRHEKEPGRLRRDDLEQENDNRDRDRRAEHQVRLML
jgi:hypothetical protein